MYITKMKFLITEDKIMSIMMSYAKEHIPQIAKPLKQKLKNMTLTEYLNQENPVWNPNVILKNDEVIVLTTIKVAGEKRSLVKVNSEDSLLKDIHYCLVNHRLYVMDYDGNPRKPSVFRLEY